MHFTNQLIICGLPHSISCIVIILVLVLKCSKPPDHEINQIILIKRFIEFNVNVNFNVNICNALEFSRSRSADIYYGQSKVRWYRCVLSCDRNEPTLEAARIVARRLFQTLGAAIEKRRHAVLVLKRGTDSMSTDDE